MKKHESIVFLVLTTAILTAALFVAHAVDTIRDQRDELVRELDTLTRLLNAEQNRAADLERLAEDLERMLLNLERTRDVIGSRGGHRHTCLTLPVTIPSGFTAARFEQAFAGTELAGIGGALVQAEAGHGINALVLAAIVAHETGWGTSRLARERCNMAGLGACGNGRSMSFGSRGESIDYLAALLATHYAPGGKHFGGSHGLKGIGKRYAADPRWAQKVAGCMKRIGGAGE